MKVSEVMTQNPEFIQPDSTIKDAAQKMKEHDCGCIPVCKDNHLVGMVTDRDIAIRAVAEGEDPNETSVDSVMTEEVHYCFEDDDIEEARKKMAELQVRRLIVLNRNKQMRGILSLGDLATKSRDHKLVADVTKSVSKD